MEDIKKVLEQGVGKIYTRYSTVEDPEKCLKVSGEKNKYETSKHQEREMLFVISGNHDFRLNNRVYKTAPGDLFMIDSWDEHWYQYAPSDYGLVHLWIFLRKNYLEAACLRVEHGFYSLVFPKIYFQNDVNLLLNRKWNFLHESERRDDEYVSEVMRNTVNLVLEEASLLFQEKISWKNDFIAVVEFIKQYIEVRHGRDCSLEHIEEQTGYSRDYIVHGFKKFTGITIGNYINQVRIAYTARSLASGMKQKEIAFELGFSTPANFWNWMQKHKVEIRKIKENTVVADSVQLFPARNPEEKAN